MSAQISIYKHRKLKLYAASVNFHRDFLKANAAKLPSSSPFLNAVCARLFYVEISYIRNFKQTRKRGA